MRLVLALLVLGLVALGFLFLADLPTSSRRSTPRGPEPVPAVQARTADERVPRAPVSRAAAQPEAPTPSPAEDFPRTLLAGRVQHSDGKPAAGVVLEIRAQGQRGKPRPLARVRTEEDGSFETHVLGTGPFRLEARAETGGGVRLAAALELDRASARDVELTLPPSGRMRGRVVDERGEPVRAFTVELRRQDESSVVRASFESEDGLFESEELADGVWQLVVTSAGYGPFSAWWSPSPDSAPDKLSKVRLTRACRLSGVVLGSDGIPRPGARVELSTALEPVFADANGAFTISGRAGQVVLQATDSSAVAGAPLELTLVPGEERAGLALLLGASGRVSGQVVTIGNRPAVGRSVFFRPLPEGKSETSQPPAFTDALGRFLAYLPPGQWEASIALDEREIEAMELATPSEEHPSEVRTSERVHVRANEKSEVWLALAPAPVRMSGKLTKAGEPCQGGEVEAIYHPGLVRYRARVEGTSYAFGLGTPGLYEVHVTFGETTRMLWVDVPSTDAYELDLDVPVGWIEGFVRTFSGERVPDVTVSANASSGGGGGGTGRALSDAEGRFVLELAPGTYAIGVRTNVARQHPRGWARPVEVRDGERLRGLELVTSLDPLGTALEVMLRGPGGELVEGGRVELTLPGTDETPDVRSADAPLGSAIFDALPPVEVEVMAEAPGYFLAEAARVRLEWSKLRRLDLPLERAFEVVVCVRSGGATGPLHDLDAVATGGLVFASTPVATDDRPGEPRFRWPLLPVGEYRLRVFAGGQVHERPLRVGAEGAEPGSLEITVP